MSDDLTQLARDETMLRALADAVNDRLRAVRTQMQAAFDDSSGIRQVAAQLPDGTEVAKVSVTDPKPEAVVVDADAFRDWVMKTRPTEIRRTLHTEVRDSYKALILNQITAAGVPEVCDKETGLVQSVPGVEVRATRARSHSVRFSKEGREAIAAAWRDGVLAVDLMPQIEAGDTDAA